MWCQVSYVYFINWVQYGRFYKVIIFVFQCVSTLQTPLKWFLRWIWNHFCVLMHGHFSSADLFLIDMIFTNVEEFFKAFDTPCFVFPTNQKRWDRRQRRKVVRQAYQIDPHDIFYGVVSSSTVLGKPHQTFSWIGKTGILRKHWSDPLKK